MRLIKTLFIIVALAALQLPALARTVSLIWDKSPSSGVAGYRVYYGSSPGVYDANVDAGDVSTWSLANLTDDKDYCFAVTALDADGRESGYSNEVCLGGNLPDDSRVIVHLSGPAPRPIISWVATTAIGVTTVTVAWVTLAECDGAAEYRTGTAAWVAHKANNLGTTDHLVVLSGLTPRTHYQYRVRSVCAGKAYESDLRSFNTK